jgi:hypothetical protein
MVYIGIGIFVLGTWVKLPLPSYYQTTLGILLISYGSFRVYRFYVNFLKKNNHD